MRVAFLFLLFLLFNSKLVLGQNQDSLKLAEAFTKALSSPSEKEIHLKEALDIKKQRKSKYVDDMYAYWNARYTFFTGDFDGSEKIVIAHLKAHPKSKGKAKFHNILGTINTMRQDYKMAISWFEKAIEDFEKNDNQKGAALVKFNIANIFFSLSDFESAYKYISECSAGLKPFNDSVNTMNSLGVLSISEAKTGRYESAVKHANEALELGREYDNKSGIALAYLALGEVSLSEKRHMDAIVNYKRSDSAALLANNVNFVHLAHVGMLSAYINLKDYENAREIGEQSLSELDVVTNRTTEFAIRKKLSEAYAGLNQFEKAFLFRRQADSIYAVTSNLKNKEYINELLIRHDSERKESQLKIERKENLIKEAKLTQQGWILFALVLVLLIVFLALIGYNNVQKSKLARLKTEQENQLMHALVDGEEKERERVANELHDGLASDLTGIKLILSQSKEKLPEGVLNALSRVHEQTRRISHNLSPLNIEQLGLVNALRNFSQENSNHTTQIHFYSSEEHLVINPIEHATLIYRISQELIQNALKHASCSTIDFQLIAQEEELTINIEDDGIGFDVASKNTSFGLSNIQRQVDLLKGECSIDSRPQKGTVVFISLPLT
ncbi:MAG: ATP-binding protein [Crocinitomicaceae bacterium]